MLVGEFWRPFSAKGFGADLTPAAVLPPYESKETIVWVGDSATSIVLISPNAFIPTFLSWISARLTKSLFSLLWLFLAD